jgi:replication factor C small subunit
MGYENHLFVEKYRPKKIEDCILPSSIKSMFAGIISDGQEKFPNMTFSGSAGSGKTTAALALANEMGMSTFLINASEENGIDVLRNKVKRYASTKSINGGMKVLILDEADNLSRAAQSALRGMVEEFSSNCRFILTCNFNNQIIDPIISRCPIVEFSVPTQEKAEMAGLVFQRIKFILEEENIQYDDQTIVEIVKKNFPDYRRMIGIVQKYSHDGVLDSNAVSSTTANTESFDVLMGLIKNKKFSDIRTWVSDHSDTDVQTFFSDFNNYLWGKYKNGNLGIAPRSFAYIVTLIGEHTYRSSFIVDNQITLMAFLSLFMVEAEFE